MPVWPFSPSRTNKDADLLLLQVIHASRNPALFGEGRVPDTLQGRFEMVVVHAVLVLLRLHEASETQLLAQVFVDSVFRHLDHGLREDGVGDLAVSKRMHRLADAFYARSGAYGEASATQEPGALATALVRHVEGIGAPFAAILASHLRALATKQARHPWTTLLESDGWIAFVG